MMYPWLSAEQPSSDAAAFGDLLAALRDKLTSNWNDSANAYLALKKVREGLGLPFIDDSVATPEQGTAASHGAWTSDLDAEAQDLQAMSALIVNALDDAVNGKRKVFRNSSGDLAIEQLPTDLLALVQDANNVPRLVGGPASPAPGQPIHVTTPGGIAPIGVGVPVIVWVATATVSILALPAYFVVDAAVQQLGDAAEQKTIRSVVEKSYDCVQSGKCTPEQAAAINKSVYDGTAGIRYAKAAETAAAKPVDWTGLVKAASWLVGIGLVGYAAIKLLALVPAPHAPRLATAKAA